MTNLSKLSGPKLRALIAKRDAERGAALDATIAAGMGMLKHHDIIELASQSSMLERTQIARRYLQTRGAWLEANEELDARKRYHGGDKPIKR
jgi:hypothetical protein